jgi:hypothetical protein
MAKIPEKYKEAMDWHFTTHTLPIIEAERVTLKKPPFTTEERQKFHDDYMADVAKNQLQDIKSIHEYYLKNKLGVGSKPGRVIT